MKRKNFKKMSDEELVALLEVADEETREKINAELESREKNNSEEGPADGTSEEPAAEGEGDAAEEKLNVLLKECQQNIGHKCRVVPVGTIEYMDGVIVGCVKIKRSNTVAYAIKLADGKRAIKNYKAPLFEISEETVENFVINRAGGVRAKAEKWSEERMNEEVAKYIVNVGRKITYSTPEGNVTGLITGIVPVTRSNSVLYRVAVPAPTEENPDNQIIVHKSVANIKAFTIAEADEDSETYNQQYIKQRTERGTKQALTGHELVLDIELKLEKAKEAVTKAEQRVKALTEALEAAKAKEESTEENPDGDPML